MKGAAANAAPRMTLGRGKRVKRLYAQRGAVCLFQGYDGERPKEGKGVGSEAAAVLYREGDQDVRASVDRNDGLG